MHFDIGHNGPKSSFPSSQPPLQIVKQVYRLKTISKGWRLNFQVSRSLKIGCIQVVYTGIRGENVKIQEYRAETRNAGFKIPDNGPYTGFGRLYTVDTVVYTKCIHIFSRMKNGPMPQMKLQQVLAENGSKRPKNGPSPFMTEL